MYVKPLRNSCRNVLVLPLVLVILVFFTLGGCTTPPEPVEEEVIETQEPEEITISEESEVPESEPEVAETTGEDETAEENSADNGGEETFTVTEEIFTKTFTDIEGLIRELNATIRQKNYDKWKTFLSEEYIDKYSDPDVLKGLSESPTLKKYNIRLTSLSDFFKYVVVPSRSDARLDDLTFVSDDRVKAIMIIDNQRVILYSLIKNDSEWKIGT